MTNIDELKNTGLKATLPRLKILEIFQNGGQRATRAIAETAAGTEAERRGDGSSQQPGTALENGKHGRKRG